MKTLRLMTLGIAVIAFVSCGGGGGGDSFFAGTWTGRLSIARNSCWFPVPPSDVTMVVNQDRGSVVVNLGGVVFTGSVTSDNSFSVAREFTVECIYGHDPNRPSGNSGTAMDSILFKDIEGDTATVEYEYDFSGCYGNEANSACEYLTTGFFSRAQ